MDGSRGSVASADGTRIGFITCGEGPALLMIHGGMCSSVRVAPVWPQLAGRCQVTAMDRRGRASSADAERYSLEVEFEDVIAVAEHLSARQGGPIAVFGHSYGAVCALGAAARGAPVGRLALYEPPGPQTVPALWLDRVRSMIAQGQLGRAMVSFLIEVIGLTREQVEALRDDPGGHDPMPIVARTLVREAEALTAVDLPTLAAAVVQPVLLLLGSVSPTWAAAVTHGLAATLPASEVELLPGQGHEAIDSAPDLVVSRLARFLLDE
jgi:pimeloyl-ACP methyl ester carboxylesterase